MGTNQDGRICSLCGDYARPEDSVLRERFQFLPPGTYRPVLSAAEGVFWYIEVADGTGEPQQFELFREFQSVQVGRATYLPVLCHDGTPAKAAVHPACEAAARARKTGKSRRRARSFPLTKKG